MNTSESIPDNRSGKQPFFVNQYSKIFFLGACAFFILSQILENVYYYFLTPEENALSTGLFLGWNFCLILFLILLPLGMGLNVRRFKLSHCWLFLILFSFLLALSDVFGVQHPYVDEIFWGEPFKRILFNWGVNFVQFSLLQGGPVLCVYVWKWIQKKRSVKEPEQSDSFVLHRVILPVIAWGMTIFLLAILWILQM